MDLPQLPNAYEICELVRQLEPKFKKIEFKGGIGMAMSAHDVLNIEIEDDERIILTQVALTLTGVNGCLPEYFNEILHERGTTNDKTLQDFLNIFHNHLFHTLYKGWKKARFNVAFEQHRKQASETTNILNVLGGLNTSFSRKYRKDVHLFYSGFLSQKNRPGRSLARILSQYYDIPVNINYYIGKWLDIDKQELTQLSSSTNHINHNQLGRDCLIGSRTWLSQNNFKINIGPLGLKKYKRLLPNGDMLADLKELAKLYASDELTPDIELNIKKEAIPRCRLLNRKAIRLGWDSWLKSESSATGQSHIRFGKPILLNQMHSEGKIS